MGSVGEDIWAGTTGAWDDFTGKTQRNARNKSNATQATLTGMANTLMDQGSASTKAASDYWNSWLNDPSAAYQRTLGQASDIGGSLAGQATNQAVNAARASGLNAGQAALAGGAQTANAFNQGTLGTQNALIGNQMTSATGQSNQGLNQQANATGTLGGVAGLQQEDYHNQQKRTDNMVGQLIGSTGVGSMAQGDGGNGSKEAANAATTAATGGAG